MRVLSVDPGMQNMAWAATFGKLDYQTGIVSIERGSPEQMVADTRKFFLMLLFKFEPNLVVMERYMTRRFANVQNELINVIIGSLIDMSLDNRSVVQTVTSAAWKNKFRHTYGISTDTIKIPGMTEHECDALIIAAYAEKNQLLLDWLGVIAGISFIESITNTCKRSLSKKRQKSLSVLG